MNAPEHYPGTLLRVQKSSDHVTFVCDNGVTLVVRVVSDAILRFRYSTDGHFPPDFSYGPDKDFEGSFSRFEVEEEESCWGIRTAILKVCIKKRNLKAVITDAQTGKEINRDEKGFHWEDHPTYGGQIVLMSKTVQTGEHYFGLGDKPMSLNLRGKRLKNWATDEYGFHRNTDPLYKVIPFYTGVHSGLAYGIFFDNTFKSFFDFASERNTATSFWAHGGEMNYYFIYGPTPIEVVERYANLTGKPELPPLWALGYHQCKWSYYPEAVVKDVARQFRERAIPCDAIYLDIDYMDGFRCFTWDQEKFPDPPRMIADLAADGFKTVAIIDPGIKIDPDYPVFREGFEKGYFCTRADGDLMKGKVWPGECVFPDFTRAEVRQWWAGLFRGLITGDGLRGIWNDMNEPAIFEVESKTFPPDVRHDFDGHPCSHRKAHNVYGMQMARATFHGVKEAGRPHRPFIITRSLYSGTQRYSATWTGDNVASWEQLWVANMQCQRMAVSGHSFIGSDIGGFTEHPSSELYVRWIQMAVFHPMMRTHSSGDHGNQEPWSFSEEALSVVRSHIEWRYRLLPYLYTTFWQHADRGTPMVRPLAFAEAGDPNTLYRNEEFLCGDHLLVCPVAEAGATSRYLYLPRGRWLDWHSGQVVDGGREVQAAAPLDRIPVFVRAGAVIPLWPVMQYVGERPVDRLTLRIVYSEGKVRSELYEDAGDGYDYRKGGWSLKTFTVHGNGSLTIRQAILGKYETAYATCRLEIAGLPFTPGGIWIDDQPMDDRMVYEEPGLWVLEVGKDFDSIRVMPA